MKPVTLSLLLLMMIVSTASFAQLCAINRPGHNMCDGNQGAYLSNTASSITIHEAGITPVNGVYNLTLSYYKQSTSTCQPIVNCSAILVQSSGNDVTFYPGCFNIPANFSSEGIVYINLTDGPGGSYFFHIYGGSCILPLPVILTAFTVETITQGSRDVVRVRWTTAQEINFDKFVIERGSTANNLDFGFDCGSVPGTNTTNPHSYEFIDQYPQDGTNFYRLRIVDQDGSFERSQYRGAYCGGCHETPAQVNCNGYNVTGPDQICLSGPYALSFQLNYSTYTWSTSPGASLDQTNARTVNVTQHDDAQGWVSVSLSRCTPATRTRSKYITLGQPFEATHSNEFLGNTPVPLLFSNQGVNYNVDGHIFVYLNSPWHAPVTPSIVLGDAVNWEWDSWTQQLSFYTVPNMYTRFRFDIETACGPRSYEFDMAYREAFTSYYTLSPNPASSQLNLYVDDRKLDQLKLKRSIDQNIQQVIIADKSGNTVLTQKYPASTRNISINISALKTDLYNIRVFDGKKWTALKFIKR